MGFDTRAESDRGQVGIGTLVVFIAMVLVAAIAAGVLLETAGTLQNRAEQTGREATDQVSNRLTVVSSYGHVTDDVKNSAPKSSGDIMPNESVDTVELTVKLSPGSGPVNLSRATISWVGPENSTTLVHGKVASYAPGVVDRGEPGTFGVGGGGGGSQTDDQSHAHEVFNTHALDGGDGTVLTEQDDQIEIRVNAGLVEAGTRDPLTPPYSEPLPSGSEVTLRITTASGASTLHRLAVPVSLTEKSSVSL
ncbi:archaellin/type IV pilin N-terminal domain-containing protein [Halorussus caseinilyticus]|uniref:archaellin/type IV pilin N-terminal domain-containing protein n=1 Tax=Halorussus caseinilyticus TaxID=3034025 RepID=UPI0023E82320|nr:archaellin/type IV pilin N-terminal domain-containing protein [Halorussus sp. DT72]